MKVYSTITECHCCHQITEVGCIETENLHIYQCSSCQKVWKRFQGKLERMIRYKEEGPDTFDEVLCCPICWRELQPNYDLWSIVCIDPTCGYSKRIPGLSREQEKIKLKYSDLRHQVFSYASKGEVPEDLAREYERVKVQFNGIKHYDKGTRRAEEHSLPISEG